MLKLRSGKVLQKPQQKEKNRLEITETKTFKVSKAPKQDDQKQQQTSRALLTKDESSSEKKEEEGFETQYEPSVQEEKQWESYDE